MFFTAENAEPAEIKKGKHETRSSKSSTVHRMPYGRHLTVETNSNDQKPKIQNKRQILDGIYFVARRWYLVSRGWTAKRLNGETVKRENGGVKTPPYKSVIKKCK